MDHPFLSSPYYLAQTAVMRGSLQAHLEPHAGLGVNLLSGP